MAIGPFWHYIRPDEGGNLLPNPSGERGTQNWGTIHAGTVGTTSSFQRFGAWSGSVAPTSNGTAGAFFGTATVGNGTVYTASAFVLGASGIPYQLQVETTDGATKYGSVNFTGGGTHQRYWVTYSQTADTNVRVVVKKNSSADTSAFYVDGVNLWPGSAQTYVDGDQEGCYWLGAPHNSESFRSGQHYAGGSIVALHDIGLLVGAEPGIGAPPYEVTAQSYAVVDGGEYQRSRAAIRPFTLECTIIGTSQEGLHATRQRLIDAFGPDRLATQQPVRFFYTGAGGTVAIDAVYEDGLGLNSRDGFSETTPIRFVAHNPAWFSPFDQGTTFSGFTNIGSTNYIAYRDPYGKWGTMAAGLNNEVTELLAINGTVFTAGLFTAVNGTTTRLVAQWSERTSAWGTLTGGTLIGGDTVWTLAWNPAGTLFVGGNYNTAAGTTNSRALAMWTGAWGTLGGTVTLTSLGVRAIKYNPLGTLFVGGDFTAAAGTAAFGIAFLRAINTWGTLTNGTLGGGAVTPTVFSIALSQALNSRVYVTGDFDTAGGTTANNIAQHQSGTWGTLGGGINADGNTLALAANNILYVGGAFSSAGPDDAALIAAWNDVQWQPLGNGLAGGAAIRRILPLSDGGLIVVGDFNQSGSTLFPDRMTLWTGYTFLPLDVDLPGANQIQVVTRSRSGTTYFGGAFVGTARTATVLAVTNNGKADTYPMLRMRHTGNSGTVRVYQFGNTRTNDYLYFDYAMHPGEELRVNLVPGARSVVSDFQGTVISKVIPGSNLATLHLQPGTNYLSFFADGTALQTDLYWRPRHMSADAGTVF